MAVNVVVFKVTGISPLLMHNPSGMGAPCSDGGVNGPTKIPSPEDEAEAGLYRENGTLYVPAIAFRNSLMAAGTGKKIGKMSAIRCISAGVFNAEVRCSLMHPKGGKALKATEYRINTSRAVIKGRGAVRRSRPEIAEWSTKVALEIDGDFITAEQVLQLFRLAGRMIGVGDWRPEKKGPYGRYTVDLEK